MATSRQKQCALCNEARRRRLAVCSRSCWVVADNCELHVRLAVTSGDGDKRQQAEATVAHTRRAMRAGRRCVDGGRIVAFDVCSYRQKTPPRVRRLLPLNVARRVGRSSPLRASRLCGDDKRRRQRAPTSSPTSTSGVSARPSQTHNDCRQSWGATRSGDDDGTMARRGDEATEDGRRGDKRRRGCG